MGVKVKIADHVADVRSFAETVLPDRRPVFVSHRYGNFCSTKGTVKKGLFLTLLVSGFIGEEKKVR